MLSRLLRSASTIFRHQSSTENSQTSTSEELREEGRSRDSSEGDMVTTRRQSSNQAALAQVDGAADTPPKQSSPAKESTPRSRKRRRGESAQTQVDGEADAVQNVNAEEEDKSDEQIDTSKRQKTLPVRRKDDGVAPEPDFERHTHIEVEIPVSELAGKEGREEGVDGGLEGVEDVGGEEGAQKEEDGLPKKLEVQKDGEEQQAEEIPAEQEEQKQEPVEEAPETKSTPISKPKHKHFNDTDPIEPVPVPEQAAPPPTNDINNEDSDSSSEDDAPEEVFASTAQAQALASARATAKALEERTALARSKRQSRDAQLKKQAEGKKRREGNYTDNVDAHLSAHEEDGDEEEEGDEGIETKPATSGKPSNPKKKQKTLSIPKVLPLEYLTDSDSDPGSGDEDKDYAANSATRPTSQAQAQGRKITFPSTTKLLEEKKPKDITLHNTTYRVLENPTKGLAPKAVGNARRVKEGWLQGGRGPGVGVGVNRSGSGKGKKTGFTGGEGVRKVPNKGFLVRR